MAEAKKCKHCGEIQPEPPSRPVLAPPRWDKVNEIERELDQRQR